MTPACHPDRLYGSRGLCSACYQRAAARGDLPPKVRVRRRATCHPAEFVRAHGLCTSCASKDYRVKNATKNAAYHRKRAYGLTQDQYDQMLQEQGGVCAVCRKPFTKVPVVDHDHQTGAVRGLLHRHCNTAVGWIESGLVDHALVFLGMEPVANVHR